MRRNFRAICSVAIGAALVALLPIFEGGNLPAAQQACPACRAELVNQQMQMNASECPHGPEYDQADCGPGQPNCCENQPGGCPPGAGQPGNGVCSCYTCGNDIGECEENISIWHVWCGLGAGNPCNANPVPGPNGPVYTYQGMTASNPTTPGGCNPQSGVVKTTYCGGVMGGGATLGCKAPDFVCVPFGPITTINGNQAQCGP